MENNLPIYTGVPGQIQQHQTVFQAPIFNEGDLEDAITITSEEDRDRTAVAPPELREYLICYYMYEDDEEIRQFEFKQGREEAYLFVKFIVSTEQIDINLSKIYAENVSIKDGISLYRFMKLMEQYYDDPNFDIEDFNN